MDADQYEICQYLKSWPGQFVSGREICRRAGGKWRYREDGSWALPVLQRMIEEKLVEADATGHFRLIERDKKRDARKRWMSPQMQRILEQSGRTFDLVDLGTEAAPANCAAGQELTP